VKRILRVGEARHEVLVLPGVNGRRVVVDGAEHRGSLQEVAPGEYRLEIDGTVRRAWIAVRGDVVHVHVDGRSWSIASIDELAETAAAAGGGTDTAEAPMPGTVVRVMASPGDAVTRGQTLVVIESMKMETAIVAWRDGVVAAVHHALGATFDRKAPLVSLEPES
jgi:biotin carboxyl carrier protein